jgi:hypothetical protein
MYIFADTVTTTKFTVDDSETNRLEVTQVVLLIADRYGFEDRSEEYRTRNEQEAWRDYTFLAQYYAPGYDNPTDDFIRIAAYVIKYEGKVHTDFSQRKWGKATEEYTEIQDRLISEFKERFGEEVDIQISTFRP